MPQLVALRVSVELSLPQVTSIPVRRGARPATFRYVPQLLLVEDDADIRVALARALSDRGHGVRTAGTAMAGLQVIVHTPPDLVVLDLGLPDMDGCMLLRMMRAVSRVPVIVATARDDESQIVVALEAGADDYVVKPFAPDHLNARIRAVLRRSSGGDPVLSVTVGALRIDPRAREAWFGPERLELSRKEFDMLLYLAARPGEVVTKSTLLAEVWQQPYGGGDKTVDVHLSWLRRKLGETAATPRYLHSVRGVGVKIVDPDSDPMQPAGNPARAAGEAPLLAAEPPQR